jgi:hypothetical protein
MSADMLVAVLGAAVLCMQPAVSSTIPAAERRPRLWRTISYGLPTAVGAATAVDDAVGVALGAAVAVAVGAAVVVGVAVGAAGAVGVAEAVGVVVGAAGAARVGSTDEVGLAAGDAGALLPPLAGEETGADGEGVGFDLVGTLRATACPRAGATRGGLTTPLPPGDDSSATTAAVEAAANTNPPEAMVTFRTGELRWYSVRRRACSSGGSAARCAARLLYGAAANAKVGHSSSTATSGPPRPLC